VVDVRTPILGRLELTPASSDELASSVASALIGWAGPPVYVASIDPALSDTTDFCAHYDVPMAAAANCVVVTGKREGAQRWAAAVVLATTRADVNGLVRKRIDVRKISFAAMSDAVELTGMEYGGITPIGLPAGWPILIDSRVIRAGLVIIGSGVRRSKIVIDGAALADLPGAEVIDQLAREI
jgi:prolyl-tRNA editing enzyme YbaK/EbsC (Cys-tRNA(Pro) deacylase)